jgi:hypothetical protein
LRWIFPFSGLCALLWFLVRVIPRPSRATYPCQRVAFPLASGFIVWLIGLGASAAALRQARHFLARSRYVVAAICVAACVVSAFMAAGGGGKNRVLADDPIPNDPVGVAKGVNPGRVVWVHDPNATDWEGPNTGEYCWESEHTDQAVVDTMMSSSIRGLAGRSTDQEAWDALFRHFNIEQGNGDNGYQPTEKIAIKINLTLNIASYDPDKGTRERTAYLDMAGDTSPQLILSLLRQLVYTVGVAQSNISVGDTTSYFPQQWYDLMAPEFPNVRYLDHYAFPGRTQVAHSTTPLYWSTAAAAGSDTDYLPVSFVQAHYVINFAVLKGHGSGMTACGKNHYGSLIRNPVGAEWGVYKNYYDLHNDLPDAGYSPGQGRYRTLVDLMGHEELGGKTVLCLIDALFAGFYWEGTPFKWDLAPFNGDWPSSLFASQDPVAIDSVAHDFLYAEWPDVVSGGYNPPGSLGGGAEDYLHEAALANSPPSGTFYDPEGDGTALQSLGVHEHWNNSTDKQYSRNLGTGNGIELVLVGACVCNDVDEDGYGDPACGSCTYYGLDCDDSDPDVNPGALEGPDGDPTCTDTLDNDCDGSADLADLGCIECVDNDSDGYGSPASGNCTYSQLDCVDSNPDVNPGAPEVCDNGIDDDCDGSIDGNDSDCASSCAGTAVASTIGSSPVYGASELGKRVACLLLPLGVIVALQFSRRRQ